MSVVIYKEELERTVYPQTVRGQVLSIAVRDTVPTAWFVTAGRDQQVTLVPTGKSLPHGKFMGTLQFEDGNVLHAFVSNLED